jgi:hypothetical protein
MDVDDDDESLKHIDGHKAKQMQRATAFCGKHVYVNLLFTNFHAF